MVVYRVSPITYAIAKQVVTVPHVAMANLIAGKRVVPELIQNNFTAANIVQQIEPLLPDGAPRESMMKELKRIRSLLNTRNRGPWREERRRNRQGGSHHTRAARLAFPGLRRILILNSMLGLARRHHIPIPMMTVMLPGKRMMNFKSRPFRSVTTFALLAIGILTAARLRLKLPERAALNITGYKIDAEIDTATHHLAATAVVSFTAPENAEEVSFGFHPALKVTKITDESGKILTGERLADGTIRVTPASPLAKGQTAHWTFEYEGTITGTEDGPVEGLKLAAIQEPITYLLYPARWFPMTGLHDRPLHRGDAH